MLNRLDKSCISDDILYINGLTNHVWDRRYSKAIGFKFYFLKYIDYLLNLTITLITFQIQGTCAGTTKATQDETTILQHMSSRHPEEENLRPACEPYHNTQPVF